jgi:hypothetical protein
MKSLKMGATQQRKKVRCAGCLELDRSMAIQKVHLKWANRVRLMGIVRTRWSTFLPTFT